MPDFRVEDGALVRFTGDEDEAAARARALKHLASGDEAAPVEAEDADQEPRGRHEAPDAPAADAPIETTAAPRASDAK